MHFKFDITNATAKSLSEIDRAKGFLEGADLSAEWLKQQAERALRREAHFTTHIEGSALTLEQAERIFDGEPIPSADSDDVRELTNYKRAFDFIRQYVVGGAPISERMILEMHRQLVQGVRGGDASPGDYREKQNYVINSVTREVIYTPPPFEEVPEMMQELIEWLNSEQEIHPVLKSGIAQFQLVHIHPFRDGNGRVSRLLSMLSLYRDGYDFKRLFSLSEFYDLDRPRFYQAIQQVRDSGMDLTGWLDFFSGGLAVQLRDLIARATTQLSAKQYEITERQQNILGSILENGKASIETIEQRFDGISRRTLQRDLKALIDVRLIVAEGATNRLTYRANRM